MYEQVPVIASHCGPNLDMFTGDCKVYYFKITRIIIQLFTVATCRGTHKHVEAICCIYSFNAKAARVIRGYS
jgi:hypothetical protein